MARYTVQCDTCGSDMDFNTFGGNSRDRQWRADHFTHECDECKQKRVALENEKNAEKNKEEGLPQLIGSEKQIAWAETLRAKIVNASGEFMENAEKFYALLNEDTSPVEVGFEIGVHDMDILDFLEEANSIENINYKIAKLLENASSSFWIDNRGQEIVDLLEDIPSEEIAVQENLELGMQKEAEIEATVRPSEPVTETIATITIVNEKKISISFPEKREDFRLLVKGNGFSWGGGAWERNIIYRNGNIGDRVADIGNQLLQNGFIIRIFDEELRQRVIEGIYEPEHTRWVQHYKGKFSIRWKRGEEDFYHQARAIPTSIWDNPTVDVKSEQFEAVLDFANEYDFRFTPKAQELLEEAQKAKESQLVPIIKKGAESKKAEPKERSFEPKEAQIDETLLD